MINPIDRLPFRAILEKVIPESAKAKVPLLRTILSFTNYIVLIVLVVILAGNEQAMTAIMTRIESLGALIGNMQ